MATQFCSFVFITKKGAEKRTFCEIHYLKQAWNSDYSAELG